MITVKTILETRRTNKAGLHFVKIRVTSTSTQKYYSTGFQMSKEEFQKIQHSKGSKKLKNVKIQLDHLELKAKQIIQGLQSFSFDGFKKEFYQTPVTTKTLAQYFEDVVSEKNKNGKISTAHSYSSSLISLQQYDKAIDFSKINKSYLDSYQAHCSSQGISSTTVGIYLRNLRAIINKAIDDKAYPAEAYPFGKKGYKIPSGKNPKRALIKSELELLFKYAPSKAKSFEARGLDFWKLSYLANGSNFKDIIQLKKTDVGDKFILFRRSKTSARKSSLVEIPILTATAELMKKWKCNSETSSFYFPFITDDMDHIDRHKTVQQFILVSNKHMKNIAKKVGINKPITSYWARHSFSKAMMDSGQPISYISKCLDHSDIKVTMNYLNSFEDYDKHSIASAALLNFA